MNVQTCVLPVPPALNHMYQRTQKGVFKTAECHVYEQSVRLLTGRLRPTTENVAMTVCFFFPKDNRDVDGGLKILLDVLQGIMYDNDRQITELHAYKEKDAKNPRVEVKVSTIITPND